jgi:hypothetical protein
MTRPIWLLAFSALLACGDKSDDSATDSGGDTGEAATGTTKAISSGEFSANLKD